jgi:hypothetical protein
MNYYQHCGVAGINNEVGWWRAQAPAWTLSRQTGDCGNRWARICTVIIRLTLVTSVTEYQMYHSL